MPDEPNKELIAQLLKQTERYNLAGPIAARLAQLNAIPAAVHDQLAALTTAANRAMEPFLATIAVLQEQEALTSRIEAAGWLAHHTMPFTMVNHIWSQEELNEQMERHYRDEWEGVALQFERTVGSYSIDEEAKATFREALDAHGAGLYRTPPRLLFPEFERVVRAELAVDTDRPITSQHEFRQAVGELGLSELSPKGIAGLRLYRKLINHLYAKTESAQQIAQARADPVPNRHAALHGVVSYTSQKSSVNMLIMADFVFGAISAIKEAMSEQTRLGTPPE